MLLGFAVLLRAVSPLYGAESALIDMPSLPVAAGMVAAGCVWLLLVPLILNGIGRGLGDDRLMLALILVFGLLFRGLMFGSTPVFEDDWYRYLWDGAVTAHGYNPYAVSPDEAQGEPYAYSLQPLARQSGEIILRINHSDLRTIYPPVAQAAFALAYAIEPWSLEAWRAVCLLAEIATAGLLLALLRVTGRPAIWLALYWWSPLAVKETMNSAHMEAITTPLVLAALLLSAHRRPVAASAALALAAGAKIWPVLLLPLILRPLLAEPLRLLAAVLAFAVPGALFALPPVLGGFDETSGLLAYAQYWQTNSAHFGALTGLLQTLVPSEELGRETAGLIVKAMLASAAGGIALVLAWRAVAGPADLLARAGLVTGALFLLSPVQFPWYALWMLPLLVLRPWATLLLAASLVPIYYASFHFDARDTYEVFRDRVVWLIWLPVWSMGIAEAWTLRRRGRPLVPDTPPRSHA